MAISHMFWVVLSIRFPICEARNKFAVISIGGLDPLPRHRLRFCGRASGGEPHHHHPVVAPPSRLSLGLSFDETSDVPSNGGHGDEMTSSLEVWN
jgi:hypothetical protein